MRTQSPLNSLFVIVRLEIKQSSEGSHHVPGIVEAKVDNLKEVWNVLQAGSNARSVGSNNVNEHSSRSHWYTDLLFSFILLLLETSFSFGFTFESVCCV